MVEDFSLRLTHVTFLNVHASFSSFQIDNFFAVCYKSISFGCPLSTISLMQTLPRVRLGLVRFFHSLFLPYVRSPTGLLLLNFRFPYTLRCPSVYTMPAGLSQLHSPPPPEAQPCHSRSTNNPLSRIPLVPCIFFSLEHSGSRCSVPPPVYSLSPDPNLPSGFESFHIMSNHHFVPGFFSLPSPSPAGPIAV